MKDFFPESLGQKCECALYMGAHCMWQNMVIYINAHNNVHSWGEREKDSTGMKSTGPFNYTHRSFFLLKVT